MRKLPSLDLSNFDISGVADMSYMFKRCESLEKIRMQQIIGRDTETDNMFINCPAKIVSNEE